MSPGVGRSGQADRTPGREAVVGSHGGSPARRDRRRRGPGGGDRAMVPEAEFTSYYGRPVVKPAPWENDIPAYLFSGGLAAGSSLLAAGGDLNDLPALRRTGRLAALGALGFSMAALVHDLGRPERFVNMLRTMKLTSPMSVGTWILSIYGPFAGAAAVGELAGMMPERRVRGPMKLLRGAARPAGLVAGLTAPPVAAYTAVLLADTATPSWNAAYRELPFVFVSSALTASGGLGMVTAPPDQASPARRMAFGGAVAELIAEQRMERSMGITAEPLHQGRAGRFMKAAKVLTVAGAAGSLLASRSRSLAVLSGAALMAGSACTRFGIFEAGQASARDPKYTVVPQRERLERGEPVRYTGEGPRS
ncbi:MAG TPA: NrfD/PsrC family molybdoenzyme membrane anchor subunit [Nocardioidaceae bacterium]|nr:NrfD/PsrC family molybdoenzyme membrane anchor subunit [Nocardioidaceae bacterium]